MVRWREGGLKVVAKILGVCSLLHHRPFFFLQGHVKQPHPAWTPGNLQFDTLSTLFTVNIFKVGASNCGYLLL